MLPFSGSFFIEGLLNNVLYVVILSAALDLVDAASTPKGIILFVNIAPALLVKVGWPYLVKGEAQYGQRIVSCSAISFIGIIIVATSATLVPRLFGIAIASFSSGLGEMTYLQLSTVYGAVPGADLGGIAVGWFASGTGAAGLVGAGLWWILRGLGVRTGLLICCFLPLCMSFTYFLLLPPVSAMSESTFTVYDFLPDDATDDDVSETGGDESDDVSSAALRQHGETHRAIATRGLATTSPLSLHDKVNLARPLVFRYMMPLFFVYLAEYTINSGVAPTLLYEIPDRRKSPVLSLIIKSLRDYYPLWQLVYQSFVFISRSSLSILRLPPIPIPFLPLPTLFQLGLLALTSLQASTLIISNALGEAGATWVTFLLVACEGLAGGSAYVNCFYWLGLEDSIEEEEIDRADRDTDRIALEREFKMASVGFADTLGILCASLVASALEPALCKAQVARGRTLCKQL
ncbi:battenin CLN3 protein [Microbotryomycetes sp. JL201]|nr:battenin CLN3 protein [Microbotryomycetes sp. JL201]